MSTNDLVKILTEVIVSAPNALPPYKHTEILEAEEYVRNGRWHLQSILNLQKQQVEACRQSLNVIAEQITALAETDENRETPVTIKDLKAQQAQVQTKLRHLLVFPSVALTVMLSRIQQLKRGITIYKILRIKKLIHICFHHLMTEGSEMTDFLDGAKDIFAVSLPILDTCSEEERATVGHLLRCLKDNKAEEMIEQFPTEVNFIVDKQHPRCASSQV
eukprot:Blabericola_migrator_1__1515@NODE_139_length_13119_cov_94_960389_g121_i0_p8_GENE_NODE_139_length_13119_cov_94_960389_g121_i0NODE_139_length_13119_cov_94_960389_g121_i0_p8_ORF_typecomplete_len218_score60_13Nup54/PF13874_6/0_0026Prominin/PF05478_11/0_65Prominin/PF05478_11/80BPS1/PF05633_11/0_096Nup88/PF10168_9/0_072CENPK/PF11802_8/0_49DUF4795/PF16043_5/0_88_NODE_139_length_13119_cov_94_960389_g121_i089349587